MIVEKNYAYRGCLSDDSLGRRLCESQEFQEFCQTGDSNSQVNIKIKTSNIQVFFPEKFLCENLNNKKKLLSTFNYSLDMGIPWNVFNAYKVH